MESITTGKKAKKTSKLKIQDTRKIGCPAKIKTFTYVLYPDYKISLCNTSHHKMSKHREELLDAPRLAIRDRTAKSCRKYYVSLPTTEAHSDHICGTSVNFLQ